MRSAPPPSPISNYQLIIPALAAYPALQIDPPLHHDLLNRAPLTGHNLSSNSPSSCWAPISIKGGKFLKATVRFFSNDSPVMQETTAPAASVLRLDTPSNLLKESPIAAYMLNLNPEEVYEAVSNSLNPIEAARIVLNTIATRNDSSAEERKNEVQHVICLIKADIDLFNDYREQLLKLIKMGNIEESTFDFNAVEWVSIILDDIQKNVIMCKYNEETIQNPNVIQDPSTNDIIDGNLIIQLTGATL